MVVKTKEKEKARQLRQDGWSVGRIAKELDVSKGSVSLWVRDIELTDAQKEQLISNQEITRRNLLAGEASKAKCSVQRKLCRIDGAAKATESDIIHFGGCMLYWAEGGKSKNMLSFSNSDAYMIAFFMKFLRCCFPDFIPNIKLRINCYLNNGLSLTDIEDYWLSICGLERDQLGKATINKDCKNRGNKKGKLPYGVCNIVLNRTAVLHHIYGALEQYAGVQFSPAIL